MNTTIVRLGLFLVLGFSADAHAGATKVSDGGHGVYCRATGRLEMLESYEARVAGRTIDLGSPLAGFNIQTRVGLEKLAREFNLSKGEIDRLNNVIDGVIFSLYNVIVDEELISLIEATAEPVVMKDAVVVRLQRDQCGLGPLAIRLEKGMIFETHVVTDEMLDFACPFDDDRNCIIIARESWNRLGEEQRALLLLHEVMRFLPSRVRPRETHELRRMLIQAVSR